MKIAIALLSSALFASGQQHMQHMLSQPIGSGTSCPQMLNASMMHMHEAMATVATTGEFDSDFMKLMIPHHEAALEMAKAELLCGKDPAARRLAQEIIADQTSEIDLMKLLLKKDSENHTQTPPKPPQDKK